MQVLLSKYTGACYGVERALSMVNEAAKTQRPVYTLGPLIHNPQVVSELEAQGIKEVGSLDDVSQGTLVIRSHGVAPQVLQAAHDRGLNVVDATCPHVKKAQKAASKMRQEGYTVLIVGENGHPEVEAINAYAGFGSLVVQEPANLPDQLPSNKIGIVVQTTQSAESLNAIMLALQARGIEPLISNTICFATRQRQESAELLAHEVDAMIVVGGRNSGNTTRLYQICKQVCVNTHHIEVPQELDSSWFKNVEKVGVTAGASTPENQISQVVAALERL